MKKIDIILVFFIIVMIVLTIVKINNQEVIIEEKIETNETEEQLRYQAERKLKYGEKGVYSEYRDDGVKVNTSSEMKKEQVIEEQLKVKDFNLECKSGYTTIKSTVVNESNTQKGGYPVKMVLVNDENKEVYSINAYLNIIEPGGQASLSAIVQGDVSDCYKLLIRKDGEEK